MNGNNFILDTNIIIALFSQDEKVIRQIGKAENVFVPVIVIGELFYGAELSTRKIENVKKIQAFAESNRIIYLSRESAKSYAAIKSELKKPGTPIPENDIWIAAIARESSFTLVTRESHFDSVKSIKTIRW